ncbi:hypothetical protein B0H14DRAFT_2844731 [Mycena olivaceomarginata]|nr:hypothetical protein B0H14DRAFT_2844731 [Mycena olivaceomarginata]
MTSHRVLLVLNIQVGLIADPPQGIPAARHVRENVATVLEQARCASHPPRIIHCRSCGDPGDLDEKGTPTWELLHAPRSGEFVIDCRKTDAFMGTALGELIAPDAELVVSTCRAALRRGNTVLLMHGAHGTHDHTVIADGGRFTPGENISARVEEELDKAGAMILDMKYLPGLFEGR